MVHKTGKHPILYQPALGRLPVTYILHHKPAKASQFLLPLENSRHICFYGCHGLLFVLELNAQIITEFLQVLVEVFPILRVPEHQALLKDIIKNYQEILNVYICLVTLYCHFSSHVNL